MIATAVAATAAGAVALIGISRTVVQRRARAAAAAAPVRARGLDGVTAGAEPLWLEGTTDCGVLLLHGFNDTPQSVSHLAHALHRAGWTVSVPLLPHHARGAPALARGGRADAWIAAAREAWTALRGAAPRAVLAGQSMGGGIALVLAAETPPEALVLLAPYVRMGVLPRLLSRVWPLWALAVPTLASDPMRSVRDPGARRASLGGGPFTPRLVAELRTVTDRAWRALRHVPAPTLVIQGRDDYRIPSPTAARAFARLAARDKTLVWLDGVGHVVAADGSRDEVARRVLEWLRARVAARVTA